MAQFTSWFLASPSDAAAIALDEGESDRFQQLTLDGILLLEIEHLGQILGLTGYEPRLLYQGDKSGPWVMAVPPDFVAALARADDLDGLADRWMELSEHLEEKGDEELRNDLRHMVDFARRAVQTGQTILDFQTG
jgi:hypothetical protein